MNMNTCHLSSTLLNSFVQYFTAREHGRECVLDTVEIRWNTEYTENLTESEKRKLRKQAKHYVSKDNLLYYVSAKGEARRVVRETEKHRILRACHSDSTAGKYIFYVFWIPSQTLHGITIVIVF